MNAMHPVLRAAVRWRRNVLDVRRLVAELEPCEDEFTHSDAAELEYQSDQQCGGMVRGPCWKHYEDGPEVLPGQCLRVLVDYCGACARNDSDVVPALMAARARRGGLTSALARAIDRLIAEAEEGR